MSNWKQYGGRTYAATNNNITASSIFCDKLTIFTAYEGSLDISGSLNVYHDLHVSGNIYTPNYIVSNHLDVSGNAFVSGDVEISGNLIVDSEIQFGNPLQAVLRVEPELLQFSLGYSLLDITSDSPTTLFLGSNSLVNENVLAHNNLGRGIESYCDSITNGIRFFGDSNDSTIDASILYRSGGVLELSSLETTFVKGNLSVGQYSVNRLGETMTVYDTSGGVFRPSVYSTDLSFGTAATFATTDLQAVTGVNIVDSSGNRGGRIVGGTFPGDVTRTLLSIGVDPYSPGLEIVTGGSAVVNRSTVGINTYSPVTDNYVLDVNGPIYIHHGEVVQTFTTSTYVYGSVFRNGLISVVGDPIPVVVGSENTYLHPVSTSLDNGVTFHVANCDSLSYIVNPIDISFTAITSCSVPPLLFVGGSKGVSYYSNDNGVTWHTIEVLFNNPCISAGCIARLGNVRLYLSLKPYSSVGDVTYNFVYLDIPITLLQAGSNISFSDYTFTYIYNSHFSVINHIFVDSQSNVYLLGNNSSSTDGVLAVYGVDIVEPPSYLEDSGMLPPGASLVVGPSNVVVVFLNNSFFYKIGTNPFSAYVFDPNILIHDVFIYDSLRSVVVGEYITAPLENQYGYVSYSNDGFSTFTPVPNSIMNHSGNAFQILQYPILNVFMPDLDHFVFLTSSKLAGCRFFSCYLPDVFHSTSNLIFSLTGLMNVTGVVESDSIHTTNLDTHMLNVSLDASFNHSYSVTGNVDTLHSNVIYGNTLHIDGHSYFAFLDINNLTVNQGLAVTGIATFQSNTLISGALTSNGYTNFGDLYQSGGDSYFQGNVHLNRPLTIDNFVVPSSSSSVGYTNVISFGSSTPTQTAYNTNNFSNNGSSVVNLVGQIDLTPGVWLLQCLPSLTFTSSGIHIDSIASCISTASYDLSNIRVTPLFIERIPNYQSIPGDSVQHPFYYTLTVTLPLTTYYINSSIYASSGIYSSAYSVSGQVQITRIA